MVSINTQFFDYHITGIFTISESIFCRNADVPCYKVPKTFFLVSEKTGDSLEFVYKWDNFVYKWDNSSSEKVYAPLDMDVNRRLLRIIITDRDIGDVVAVPSVWKRYKVVVDEHLHS